MAMTANNPGVSTLSAKIELAYDQFEVTVVIKYRDYNPSSGRRDGKLAAMELQAKLLEIADEYKAYS